MKPLPSAVRLSALLVPALMVVACSTPMQDSQDAPKAATATAEQPEQPASNADAKPRSCTADTPQSYAGRLIAAIRPNIAYRNPPPPNNNPRAEVEVLTAPNGAITSRRLLKPSGVAAWDDAVLYALDKTATLPLDADGCVPGLIIITFTPHD